LRVNVLVKTSMHEGATERSPCRKPDDSGPRRAFLPPIRTPAQARPFQEISPGPVWVDAVSDALPLLLLDQASQRVAAEAAGAGLLGGDDAVLSYSKAQEGGGGELA
jgi:hypothetical protein